MDTENVEPTELSFVLVKLNVRRHFLKKCSTVASAMTISNKTRTIIGANVKEEKAFLAPKFYDYRKPKSIYQ
ncbi:unnamed protein product [Arabidopsis halleri]